MFNLLNNTFHLPNQTAKSTFHPLFLMLWDLTPTAFEIRDKGYLLAVWLVGANGGNVRTFTKIYNHIPFCWVSLHAALPQHCTKQSCGGGGSFPSQTLELLSQRVADIKQLNSIISLNVASQNTQNFKYSLEGMPQTP